MNSTTKIILQKRNEKEIIIVSPKYKREAYLSIGKKKLEVASSA